MGNSLTETNPEAFRRWPLNHRREYRLFFGGNFTHCRNVVHEGVLRCHQMSQKNPEGMVLLYFMFMWANHLTVLIFWLLKKLIRDDVWERILLKTIGLVQWYKKIVAFVFLVIIDFSHLHVVVWWLRGHCRQVQKIMRGKALRSLQNHHGTRNLLAGAFFLLFVHFTDLCKHLLLRYRLSTF
jgi:hypothetical protein